MRSVVAPAVLAAVTALTVGAGAARGDGGPAMTLGVAFQRGDTHSLYVMTNYGLVVSRDDGCTFFWVCETNIGYGNTYIPKLAITDDGAILATTFRGLRASRDGGCTFATAAGPVADIAVEGLTVAPNGEVWVTTSESGKTNDVFVSRDGARTFEARGLASTEVLWKSVLVAPSDPARIYVSGLEFPSAAHLRRSEGTGWFVSPLTGIAIGSSASLVVAAIDPSDPDLVYVVHQGATVTGDKLYRSTDGGATFGEVLAVTGQIRDVVARDAQVYVATQVPDGPSVRGGPVYLSSDRGGSFAPLEGAPQLMCLGAAPDGSLVGCGANWMPDFMAVTRFDGQAWSKVWRFVELAGPLSCAPGTGGHDICDTLWSSVDINLQTSGPSCGPLARDAGVGTQPPKDPGCCFSSASQPTGLLWAFALLWWLRRRRPRSERG